MGDITKVVLACDESGAKGYADKSEAYPGEVGVFAGILVPEECMAVAKMAFQEIHAQYETEDGKLHITDLSIEDQEALRRAIFEEIAALNLPCFWYAIHVEGFRSYHEQQAEAYNKLENDQAEARGGESPRIKSGSHRPNPKSLHKELFGGLYGHLIAFLEERGRTNVSVEIRTDQVDAPIVRGFEQDAKALLSEGPASKKITGFDTRTNSVVEGAVIIDAIVPPELEISLVVQTLSLVSVRGGDGLVLAADVLANSLNYLFKSRNENELYQPLNCPEAIIQHQLADQLSAFSDWGEGDAIGDRLYAHPHRDSGGRVRGNR